MASSKSGDYSLSDCGIGWVGWGCGVSNNEDGVYGVGKYNAEILLAKNNKYILINNSINHLYEKYMIKMYQNASCITPHYVNIDAFFIKKDQNLSI